MRFNWPLDREDQLLQLQPPVNVVDTTENKTYDEVRIWNVLTKYELSRPSFRNWVWLGNWRVFNTRIQYSIFENFNYSILVIVIDRKKHSLKRELVKRCDNRANTWWIHRHQGPRRFKSRLFVNKIRSQFTISSWHHLFSINFLLYFLARFWLMHHENY